VNMVNSSVPIRSAREIPCTAEPHEFGIPMVGCFDPLVISLFHSDMAAIKFDNSFSSMIYRT